MWITEIEEEDRQTEEIIRRLEKRGRGIDKHGEDVSIAKQNREKSC